MDKNPEVNLYIKSLALFQNELEAEKHFPAKEKK
jgi:hypothetical protein